jgi:hypothetical protein
MPELKLESPRLASYRGLKVLRELLFVALLIAVPGFAQSGGPPIPRTGMQHSGDQSPFGDDIGPDDPAWGERRLRMLNAERQKELVADTNKLLKLAQQLDAEIAGANPDSLTPDQLRRVAEIEKLARSVKDKMSTSVRPTPAFRPEPSR